MKSIQNFNETCHTELLTALESAYKIRADLRKTLIETYNDELVTKIARLTKIIGDAEFLVNRKEDIKEFYEDKYPEFVNEDKIINLQGVNRVSALKKKWKKLGYLKK